MARMHQALSPRMVIPIHGEHRHLAEHARMSDEWCGAASIVAPNGTLLRLDADRPQIESQIDTGRVYLDGHVQVGALDGVVRDRLKLARQGIIVASVVLDEEGLLADSEVRCFGAPKGLTEEGVQFEELIAQTIDQTIDAAPKKSLKTEAAVEELATRAIRHVAMRQWGKRPVIAVLVTRLEES